VSGSALPNYLVDRDFVDTCAVALGNAGESGYTFNVLGNPYAGDTPKRIDYIFARGEEGAEVEVVSSEMVLNRVEGAFMSDRCGVLSQIKVPAPTQGRQAQALVRWREES
jgi:hypothetical protein